MKTSRQIKRKADIYPDFNTPTQTDRWTSRYPHIQKDIKVDIQIYRKPIYSLDRHKERHRHTGIGTSRKISR